MLSSLKKVTAKSLPWGTIVGMPLLCSAPFATYWYYWEYIPAEHRRQVLAQWLPPTRRTSLFVAGDEGFEQGGAISTEISKRRQSTHDYLPPLPDPRPEAVDNKPLSWRSRFVFALKVWRRLAYVLFASLPIVWDFVYRYLCGHDMIRSYTALGALFVKLGPTYIKLGQWMATRPDLFPPALCHELSHLYDAAPAHAWEDTEAVLKRPLERLNSGQCLLDFLSEVDRAPMNSGSVAQVHRGVLRVETAGYAAGTELALKILHPDVESEIWTDIWALRKIARAVVLFVPHSRYLDPLVFWHEFALLLISQLDLRREADNLEQFSYNFRDFSGVCFPKPFLNLSDRRVLVETFEIGYSIQNTKSSKPLADLGIRMFLKMIFKDNFVHADLHPGNILVRVRHPDGSVGLTSDHHKDRNEIVVLDCGLVTSLTGRDRENFLLLFSAVACGDSELAAELMIERSPSAHCQDLAAFKRDMRDIFAIVAPQKQAESADSGFRLSRVEMGAVLGRILNCMRLHHVAIDGHFATLVMTVIVGEGLGRRLYPEYNIFAASAPFLIAHLHGHELSRLAVQLQTAYGLGVVRDLVV